MGSGPVVEQTSEDSVDLRLLSRLSTDLKLGICDSINYTKRYLVIQT